jgi:pimeloyl-ACP methyl ester carboxylesterase
MGIRNGYRANRVKTGYVRTNETRLFYERQGRGFPAVFVSGGGVMDRRCWDEEFESFAKYFSVIRYDVRGIGKSERPKVAFSHSRDLYELLTFLKIKRAHVIGLSVGGAIAIDFTLEHPEMVDHLVLAASGISDDVKAEANEQGLTMLSEMTRKQGIESVAQVTVNTPFVISKENETQRERIRRIYNDNRDVFESGFPIYSLWHPTTLLASARLSQIHAPTLVVRGDRDNPAYIKLTDKIASAVSGARKVVIPGGTHFINLDKPKAFAEAVLNFLRS